MKLTSGSEIVLGIVFGMNCLIYFVTGKAILAGIWFICSVLHFIAAYRLHCKEKDEI